MVNIKRYGYISAKARTLKSSLLDRKFFYSLASSRSVGDLVVSLKNTWYGSFISKADTADFYKGLEKSFNRIFDLFYKPLNKREKELLYLFFQKRKGLIEEKVRFITDRDYTLKVKQVELDFLNRMKKLIKKLPATDRTGMNRVLGSFYDLENILTCVRLRVIYGLQPEEVFPFIMPYGYRLKPEVLIKLVSAGSLSQISAVLKDSLGFGFSDFVSLRKAVYRYHIEQVNTVWYGYPFRLSVPFGFLRLKEIEITNLKAVFEGVRLGVPEEEIRKMLVGVDDAVS